MEKQQEAAAAASVVHQDSISSVGVTMHKDYAPSEVFTSEPPPAYVRTRGNAVQIARIAALTLIAVSFILGGFMLASAYISATYSCQYQDYPLEQREGEDRPQFQSLVDPLESEETTQGKNVALPPEQDLADRQESNKRHRNKSPSQDEEEMNPIQIKLPLQLDFDELAGSLMEKNERARMNCVVEKRRAEEVLDHQGKTVRLPFGLNLTTDPSFEHVTGERMAIFCESGNQQRQVPMEQQITPIMVPVPVPHPMPIHRMMPHPPMHPQMMHPPMHPAMGPQMHPQMGPQLHPQMMHPGMGPQMHPQIQMMQQQQAAAFHHPPPPPPPQHHQQQLHQQQLQQQQQQQREQEQQIAAQIQEAAAQQALQAALVQVARQARAEQSLHQQHQQQQQQQHQQQQVPREMQHMMPPHPPQHHQPEHHVHIIQEEQVIPVFQVERDDVPSELMREQVVGGELQVVSEEGERPQNRPAQLYHRLPLHQPQHFQPPPSQEQPPRPHFVQPRSVRSVDSLLHRREKRVRRCACDCSC